MARSFLRPGILNRIGASIEDRQIICQLFLKSAVANIIEKLYVTDSKI